MNLKPKRECVKQGFGKAMYRKFPCVKGVPRKSQWMHRPTISSIGYKKRWCKPAANTAKKAKQTMEIAAKLSKPSAWWARRGQSWAQHILTKDEDEREGVGGVVQVRRGGKNPRSGGSLDKNKRQYRQHNYEQARSIRHAGRPGHYDNNVTVITIWGYIILILWWYSRKNIMMMNLMIIWYWMINDLVLVIIFGL